MGREHVDRAVSGDRYSRVTLDTYSDDEEKVTTIRVTYQHGPFAIDDPGHPQ